MPLYIYLMAVIHNSDFVYSNFDVCLRRFSPRKCVMFPKNQNPSLNNYFGSK